MQIGFMIVFCEIVGVGRSPFNFTYRSFQMSSSLCEILGSYIGEYKDVSLVVYSTLYSLSGPTFLRFWDYLIILY
jgi:hypothetical protein